jgi:NADPH:quinone reductase-like Zn-dependent oxidoreductase
MSQPVEQKALWLKAAQGEFEVGPKPIDKPGPHELLVKIEATALNPVSFVSMRCWCLADKSL